MKNITATDLARNLSHYLSELESGGEDLLLVRNDKIVARLVAEPPAVNALDVFGDLYQTLDEDTAQDLTSELQTLKKKDTTISKLRQEWDF